MENASFEKMNIQWFPGHMTKAQRMIGENLKMVDAVCELLDARIPGASRNPDIDTLAGDKPRLVILNRCDLADPAVTARWRQYFEKQGLAILETDARSGKGVSGFAPAVRRLLADKQKEYEAKGQVGRPLRVMILGIPNVGKSTFINQVAGRKGAKAENRPGVTRGKQWVTVDPGLLLLDTPGILWPKFEDPEVGLRLAWTGAVKDDILDTQTLAARLMAQLWLDYPQALRDRYKLDGSLLPPDFASLGPAAQGFALMEQAAKNRGFLLPGAEIDLDRMANVLLEEYRFCKLGCFTLENVKP